MDCRDKYKENRQGTGRLSLRLPPAIISLIKEEGADSGISPKQVVRNIVVAYYESKGYKVPYM